MPTEFDPNLVVRLVWDGVGEVALPSEVGTPTPEQFRGTEAEKVVEAACRVCYDSFGLDGKGKPRGRSTQLLHTHIREVENHSVYDHATFTLRFRQSNPQAGFPFRWLLSFLNRPGAWVTLNGTDILATVNLRTAVEWDRHTGPWNDFGFAALIGEVVRYHAAALAPQIFPEIDTTTPPSRLADAGLETAVVPPYDAHSAWLTLYLQGSRGFSHECVRHHWESGVSQRSTRYCDEIATPYIAPPLLTQFLTETDTPESRKVAGAWLTARNESRSAYNLAVAALQQFGVSRGLDKTPARKQARGAARGILGNSLMTCLVFSASLAQWRGMLQKRLSALADPEIRLLFGQVFPLLRQSRHGHYLQDFDVEPSPDGIGEVLVDRATRHPFS